MKTFITSFLLLLCFASYSQFISVQAGDWDNCATWGTCPGTTIGVDYPGRNDNVSIGHAVSVNNTLDNSATNTQPNDEAIAGVCGCTGSGTTGCGNNPTGCNANAFYHKGTITITNGGAFTSTVATVFEGDVEVQNGGSYRLNANSTLFLIGRIDVRDGGSFISNQNLIVSGPAILNIESTATAGAGDDLYFDGDNSFVCGDGTLALDGPAYYGGTRNNSIRHYNTSDNSTTDQICSGTTITCQDGNCCGGQCQPDMNTDGSDGTISPGEGGATSSVVLPVELVAFDWEDEISSIKIHWTTASELNNEGFDLYKSTDGKDFAHLAFIQGGGNSNTILHYDFVDHSPVIGANYYRLIQRDFDGKSEDLGVIRAFSKAADLFTIYPNPANEKVTVLLGNQFINTTTNVRLYSISGEMIYRSSFWINSNSVELALNYEAGIYFIEADNGTYHQKKRLIIK
ncbi:T9SS type A sorting domain-containing protein [Ekhidna sp.]|uniref:T9SS type A sorting domain-containing protein n=1 Tax=Ekhidna sp. TaxID=2608089 RepID=UPI003518D3CB